MSARTMMASVIENEALRFQFLADSEKLTDREKELYKQLVRLDNKNDGMFLMSASVLSESLHTLSQLLEKYYGQKVVMIIDELAISSETQGSTVPGMCSITARPFGQI